MGVAAKLRKDSGLAHCVHPERHRIGDLDCLGVLITNKTSLAEGTWESVLCAVATGDQSMEFRMP